MKKILILLLLCPYWGASQNDCLKEYETLMDAAYKLATQKNPDYQQALKTYTAAGIVAKDCNANKTDAINSAIRKIFDKMNQDLERAKKAEQEATAALVTAEAATAKANTAQDKAEAAQAEAQKVLDALTQEQKALEDANKKTQESLALSRKKTKEIEASIVAIEAAQKRTEAALDRNIDASLNRDNILGKIHFYRGLAVAQDKASGKYGLINSNGNVVVPFAYEEEPSYSFRTGLFETSKYYFDDREKYTVCKKGWEISLKSKEVTYIDIIEENSFPSLNVNDCEQLRVYACTGIQEEKLWHIPTNPRLEKILLKDCYELKELSSFIGDAKSLKVLLINGNFRLKKLPERLLELEKLEVLNLNGCYNLASLPNGLEALKKLKKIDVRETKIPASKVKKLQQSMPWCKIYY